MKKQKNKFPAVFLQALFLLIILIFIASCTGTNNNQPVDIRVGAAGLTMEFMKNTPPEKLFEKDVFPVMLRIKNIGAYSIKNNDAVVSLGVEKDYTKKISIISTGKIQDLDSSVAFPIEGRSQVNPIGSEEIVSYNIESGKIDPQSEYHQSTLIATLCYPYETELHSSVCIDTDINNLRPSKKVCNMQDLSFPSGQGAPVAVTKIETQMLPLQLSEESSVTDKIKPQFLIYVENKGPGLVIKTESTKDFCTKSDTTHENYNIVKIDAELSGKPLKCQIDEKENQPGHVKLKDKKDIIRCDLKEGIERNLDSYSAPIKIKLAYGYTQSISTSYVIQKASR